MRTVLYIFPSTSVTVGKPGQGPPLQAVVVIITSSVEAVQGELEIVQRNVAVPVTANPVTPYVG